MLVEIDMNLVKAYNLSIDEYVLLLLLNKQHNTVIRDYFTDDEELYKKLDKLVSRKFIVLNTYGSRDCLSDYKIIFMPGYLKEDFDKWFDELISTYPKKVRRPDGQEDILILNTPKLKKLYEKVTKKNLNTHSHIIKCLKFQLQYLSKKTSGLMYMRRLERWLENQEWKNYEDVMLNSQQVESDVTGTINKEEAYGQRII